MAKQVKKNRMSSRRTTSFQEFLSENDTPPPALADPSPGVDTLRIIRVFPQPVREIKFYRFVVDTQAFRVKSQ